LKKIVLHIVPNLYFGGVEKHMEIISNTRDSTNFNHIFLAIGKGGYAENAIKNNNSEIFCLNYNVNVPNVISIFALMYFIFKIKPSIIHTHGAQANFHGILAAWFCKVKIRISEEVGISKYSIRGKLGFKMIFKFSHSVIAVSKAVQKCLLDENLIESKKTVQIYNPVLLSKLHKKDRSKLSQFKVGFIGRLVPEKNPMGLILAINILKKKHSNFILQIIGDGPQKSDLEEMVNFLRLSEYIEFLGFHSNPEEFLVDFDFYIQPSIAEGFGIAICEAMGIGIPVIVTPNGGMPEIVDHGRTGFIAHNSSPEALAEAMSFFISLGKNKLINMGNLARKSILTRFNSEKYILNIESLYEELLYEFE
jgi:glycosyltransferase involved in cell wall biosynthesis